MDSQRAQTDATRTQPQNMPTARRAAASVTRPPAWTATLGTRPAPALLPSRGETIQTKFDPGTSSTPATEADTGVDSVGSEPLSGAFIVEDDAETLGDGQMRRSDFLAQLREAVCATAEEALAGTEWSAVGCPWVDYWFNYYGNRDSSQIERAIRKYAPTSASATSAADYIPIITDRVRTSISVWTTTGEITGVPEGVPTSLPATPPESSGESSMGEEGGEGEAIQPKPASESVEAGRKASPAGIRSRLGQGRGLDGRVKTQMESAFGRDFSHVRVHDDAGAASLSRGLQARAFTVGEHVAFGAGEFRPGTLIGDALIAHELAHVAQQTGGGGSPSEAAGPQTKGNPEYGALEDDADMSAVGAVTSIWGGVQEVLSGLGKFGNIAGNVVPSLRSGLRLQRCDWMFGSDKEKEADKALEGGKEGGAPEAGPGDAGTEAGTDGGTTTPATPQPSTTPATPASTGQTPAAIDLSSCKKAVQTKLKKIMKDNPQFTLWEVETAVSGDGYQDIAKRVKLRNSNLFNGRSAIYAKLLQKLNGESFQAGQCIILPVGWVDPNIGTLPAQPTAGKMKATDPATKAIAVVYAEQTGTGTQAQEQQRYIWYSMRVRVGSALYPPTLDSAIEKGGYFALNGSDYKEAVKDLTTNATPTNAGVLNAKNAVLNNWTTAVPADAGPAYFHWRKDSTPDKCFAGKKTTTDAEKETAEKECAHAYARQNGFEGSITAAQGWGHRIRGDGGGLVGTMYIYPGAAVD